MISREVSPIRGRREARRLAECGGERACLAEADRQSDLGHRGCGFRQQYLGVLDASAAVISMRRHSERLLEGTAEIVRAQADELREGRQRYLLGKMFLDVGGDRALLPSGKSATGGSLDAWSPGIETPKLMREDGAEGFAVAPVVGPAVDQCRQLERRFPQRAIFEEQAGRKRRVDIARPGIDRYLGGIEIEIYDASENASLVPHAIFMTGRHKGKLAPEVSQR